MSAVRGKKSYVWIVVLSSLFLKAKWKCVRANAGRGVHSMLWAAAGGGFLGLALVSGAVDYVSFDSFGVPSLDRIRQVTAAVVFTGPV